MNFRIPVRQNEILQQVVERVNQDQELLQLWRCVNINSVDRLQFTDHGIVHIKIVANMALKLVRMLADAGIEMSVVTDYGLTQDDAEVIVVLAACLHDLGISVHRDNHETYSICLANPKAKELLNGLYDIPERTIMVSEILHAISAHHWDQSCLTIEAGTVKVADALDMTEGRSRIPFEAGATNIHTVSAAAVDKVKLTPGQEKPVRVEITMSNSAGIFLVDELLKRKLRNSSIVPYVEVVARIEGEAEKRLIEFYAL
ncbi:MAG: HD domain-containing protein [Anaerolineae bacterium]|nr:HD domain-containing protein [Anaerolineae bacterium]NIN93558.1 HD domain-containing protein [Anaerolineae bacterium]NIQ76641.1 HD domain-containing protein [Anaerolineae bacterium]